MSASAKGAPKLHRAPKSKPRQASDPSGVHARATRRTVEEWAEVIAFEGPPSPAVQGLLNAYGRLEQRVEQAERRDVIAQRILDRLNLSVHVVSEDGVLLSNRAARKLEREGVLQELDGELHCTSFEAREELAAAIRKAQTQAAVCEPFVLIRTRKPRLLGVVLSGGRSLPGAAIVVLSDPSDPPEADEEVFCRHFGLTPAEGRIARCLVLGETARQIAEDQGIGVETVRTHIKSMRRKMGVSRQLDAVRLLVTGPLALS